MLKREILITVTKGNDYDDIQSVSTWMLDFRAWWEVLKTGRLGFFQTVTIQTTEELKPVVGYKTKKNDNKTDR